MTSSAASKPPVAPAAATAPAAPAALGAGNTVHFMHAARLLARGASPWVGRAGTAARRRWSVRNARCDAMRKVP
ncbi:MAG: hypothetical protein R2713_20110 [Ilumatobacteraceae bacterium]